MILIHYFSQWQLSRWLRLALGLLLLYSGWMDTLYPLMLLSLVLVYQAFSKQGCAYEACSSAKKKSKES